MKTKRFLLIIVMLSVSALFSSCATNIKPSVNGAPGAKKYINSIGMEFIEIPSGSFTMKRLHRLQPSTCHVNLDGFYMQTTEVTQDQWFKIMGTVPSYFKGKKRPVERVNWYDVQAFIKKLNAKEKTAAYRLPTEAEWEYACRAGTTTPYNTGKCLSSVSQANFSGERPYRNCPKGISREKTVPVKSFPPNAWGLYDMHGNVKEWCSDWHEFGHFPSSSMSNPTGPSSGYRHVVRGGGWRSIYCTCTSEYRDRCEPGKSFFNIGFRLVMDADGIKSSVSRKTVPR